MFGLLIYIILISCSIVSCSQYGAPPLDPDPSTLRPKFDWLDGHEESIADGESLKLTVKNGRVDAIVREAIFHTTDVEIYVNHERCSLGYILMYFAKRVGNFHYSRLGCQTELDAEDVSIVGLALFPNDDGDSYVCLPPKRSIYNDKIGLKFKCRHLDREDSSTQNDPSLQL